MKDCVVYILMCLPVEKCHLMDAMACDVGTEPVIFQVG